MAIRAFFQWRRELVKMEENKKWIWFGDGMIRQNHHFAWLLSSSNAAVVFYRPFSFGVLINKQKQVNYALTKFKSFTSLFNQLMRRICLLMFYLNMVLRINLMLFFIRFLLFGWFNICIYSVKLLNKMLVQKDISF